jgi:hypothetical protein
VRANEFIAEKWSEKYKRSINCSRPRGFSQRAHCAGRKKSNEDSIREFAVDDNDDGQEPDEFEILRRLAAQWYHGDEDPRAEKTLAVMGWEIGHIESGDPNDAVFIVRPNDEQGNSYIGFSVSDLKNLNEQLYFKGSPCTVDCSGHRAGYEWWFRKRRTPNSWSRSFNNGAALAAAGK